MARSTKCVLVLQALASAGLALQLAPDGAADPGGADLNDAGPDPAGTPEGADENGLSLYHLLPTSEGASETICGAGFKSFEHFVPEEHPNVCAVYCVPNGECVQFAEEPENFRYLELTGRGDCQSHGYTEHAPLGRVTTPLDKKFKGFTGFCKGMFVLPFRKPAGPDAPDSPATEPEKPPGGDGPATEPEKPPRSHWICGEGSKAFQAITPRSGRGTKVCSVYCVPTGDCLGKAQTGELAYLGITSEGNCRKDGYTERYRVKAETRQWLAQLKGPCAGMTAHNFRLPGTASESEKVLAPLAPNQPVCEGSTMAYEAHSAVRPNTCGVFCVPEGQCEGLVQTGHFNLGITLQGNCRGRGFTVPSPADDYEARDENIQDMLSGFRGPCKGMTYRRFQKPDV